MNPPEEPSATAGRGSRSTAPDDANDLRGYHFRGCCQSR